ncbi:MAG: ATP-dependent sacrificial sulfur transferase LarE [Thermoplasmata archaeon]
MSAEGELEAKAATIVEAMRSRGGVLVAYSGGVDSGLVCKLAVEALGPRAVAVTAVSESLPGRELKAARRFAREVGIRHRTVSYSELANREYARNPKERCYFCRKDLAKALKPIALEEGMSTIADGVLSSDLGEWRPGIKAMNEEGFWHPLLEHDIDKVRARRMARWLGLSFHDKPSMACLSSRIPYGEVITVEKLRRIEEAEDILHSLGLRQFRVRHHGSVARIEVPKEEVPRLLQEDVREEVSRRMKALGFEYVTLDLEGYRTGSMDAGL